MFQTLSCGQSVESKFSPSEIRHSTNELVFSMKIGIFDLHRRLFSISIKMMLENLMLIIRIEKTTSSHLSILDMLLAVNTAIEPFPFHICRRLYVLFPIRVINIRFSSVIVMEIENDRV